MRKTKPAALPEPAPVNLYVRHGLALAEAVKFLRGHWISYTDLIPREFQDGVSERRIFDKFAALVDELYEYTTSLAVTRLLTDEGYRSEHAYYAESPDHSPVEQLAVVLALADAADLRGLDRQAPRKLAAK